ncbi:MAG: YoaK family protein [Salipiger thiooxidans]|uniref:YoaK family protein n=1 Tax=Salipiger thiooxidans TaxID=282683 RepID=UPI001CFADFC6|nr:YoaK family protein [Salipiger thiooxidans]
MLFREGNDRNQSIDLGLAALLSLVAGALNATGFEVAGLFSANMTGNVSAMADKIASGAWGVALLFALVVALFVSGALLAGLAIEWARGRNRRGIYAALIEVEAAILLALGGIGLYAPGLIDGVALIGVLGFTLGLQNAVTTRISSARVRTTHVSGMATDVGLALAGLWVGRNGAERHRAQLALHATTIAAFVVGGILGALSHAALGAGTFLLCGLPIGIVAAREMARQKR